MSTKLTIIVDSSVIGRAKQYARSRGRSLSNLIEDYLRALTDEQQSPAASKNAEPTSKAQRLYGILAPLGQDLDYREVMEEELSRKYL